MRRRIFLGSMIGLAIRSVTVNAQSQEPPPVPFDPDPILVHVKTIVVHYLGVVSDDRSLLTQFHPNSFGVEVAEFIASRFDGAGHPVVVIDSSRLGKLPEGIREADVLYVSFRIDLSSVRIRNDPAVAVGTVSTHLRRGEFDLLFWVPMTHFVLDDQSTPTKRAQQALFDQAQKSVVDQIVYVKERGF